MPLCTENDRLEKVYLKESGAKKRARVWLFYEHIYGSLNNALQECASGAYLFFVLLSTTMYLRWSENIVNLFKRSIVKYTTFEYPLKALLFFCWSTLCTKFIFQLSVIYKNPFYSFEIFSLTLYVSTFPATNSRCKKCV